MSELAERGAALLGARLVRAEALGGGSLSQIVRITLVHSRQAIVKTGPSPPTEAAMLRAIAASGTPAPAILAADTQVLIIASLPQAGWASEAWSDLGAQLARLHAVRGTDFAWDEDYALGSVWIENAQHEDWLRFWAERRLLPLLPEGEAGLAPHRGARHRPAEPCLPAGPAPALLHGDLWSGNVLAAGDRISGLIDPALLFRPR